LRSLASPARAPAELRQIRLHAAFAFDGWALMVKIKSSFDELKTLNQHPVKKD
jgi:hypothetical protein